MVSEVFTVHLNFLYLKHSRTLNRFYATYGNDTGEITLKTYRKN